MAKVPANRPHRPPKSGRSGPPSSGTVQRTIPSDYAHGRELQRQILDELDRQGYSDQSAFAIRISLEEALVNAIRHGNRLDPTKHVHVAYTITPRQAEFYIEDEGKGFDRSRVPDPTCDENLEKCSGRGILLIEAYMNKVEFDRGGRRLHMVKRREERVRKSA